MICTRSMICKCTKLQSNMKVNIIQQPGRRHGGGGCLPLQWLDQYHISWSMGQCSWNTRWKESDLYWRSNETHVAETIHIKQEIMWFQQETSHILNIFLALSYLFYYCVQYYTEIKLCEYWCHFNPPVLSDNDFCPQMLFNCIISHL